MPNGWHEDQQAVQERLQRQEQAENERRANAEKQVDERLGARDESVREYYEQSARSPATPTQRECDLLRMGVQLENYENPGESDEEWKQRVMEGRLSHNNPYETRALEAGGGEQPRRRGRPPKNPDAPHG